MVIWTHRGMGVLSAPFLDAVRRTCLGGLIGRAPMSARPLVGPPEGPRREHKAANLFSHLAKTTNTTVEFTVC